MWVEARIPLRVFEKPFLSNSVPRGAREFGMASHSYSPGEEAPEWETGIHILGLCIVEGSPKAA